MPKIGRKAFVQEMKDKTINVNKAKQSVLGKTNLNKADLNHDGKITGAKEMDKLFLQIDTFDHDGSYHSMNMTGDVKNMVTTARTLASEKNIVTTTVDGIAHAIGEATSAVQSALSDLGITSPLGVQLGHDTNANGGKRMQESAKKLIEEHAEDYGVQDAWVNIDPHHALPANVSLGGLRGKWKCNLFAGNTMAQAGFEPPYYGNKGKGEYPNANQLYKWSDQYAGKYHNKTHFKMVGELDVNASNDHYKDVKNLLANAKVGDMIIVDHQGDGIADGGHCRVLVSKNDDGTWNCAQASSQSAIIREETVNSFTGEEHVWILRPNRPRVD